MPTDIHLSFESDDDREATVEALRKLGPIPDAKVQAGGEDVTVTVDVEDANAALVRVQTLLRGALDGTDVALERIRRSAEGDWR
jgi:hypothetical protein